MKLRTSFFNKTVLKKDMTRFAPLWGIYTVLMLIFLIIAWDGCGNSAQFMNSASGIMAGMGILNMIYAGLSGILLFGDLFDPRTCNMLHAMPVRREGWFVTHLMSGLLFSVVPNLLGCLITAAMLGRYAYGALLWFALMVLEYLLFFGIAAFAAQCAGNRLGAMTIYCMVNFFGALATWLVQLFYEPLLYGMRLRCRFLEWFRPVGKLLNGDYLITEYDNMTQKTVLQEIPTEPWIYAGVAAVVGIGLMVLALVIYRKRSLENAGNLISLKPVTPVFLVLWSLCVGVIFYGLGTESYLLLLIGSAVGFFTGRMLLEKKVHVFSGKNMAVFGVAVVIFVVTLGLTAWDPVGVTREIPETDEISSVCIYPWETSYDMFYEIMPEEGCLLTDTQDVEQIRALHQYMVENKTSRIGTEPVTIVYELKNNRTVERYYNVPTDSEYMKILSRIYSRPEYVLGEADLETLLENVISLQFQNYEVDGLHYKYNGNVAEDPDAKELLEAIYQDCCEGTMDQWSFGRNAIAFVTVRVMNDDGIREYQLEVYQESTNTRAVIQSLQNAEE